MNSRDLPEEFLAQQQRLLGEEYPEYLASFSESWSRGLRVNVRKLSPERFRALSPVPLEPVPWIPNGFYFDNPPPDRRHAFRDAKCARQTFPCGDAFAAGGMEAYLEDLPPDRRHAFREAKCARQTFPCGDASFAGHMEAYLEDRWNPAKDPYYYAGLYYLQEPSAMTPAAFLPVKPGDKVLDLCAAPGGKATELGARLEGRGLLFANDISNSRAKGLLKNLELLGIPNICVTSETPEALSRSLPQFFDCILVDAPCSGEGMFRKEPGMVKDWRERGPEYYAPVQREILTQAEGMLRPGGYLLYSTCTFSPLEDEENVSYLLCQFPQLELEPLPLFPGASEGFGLSGVLRLFPHRVRGEGHFLALFRKKGGEGRQAFDSADGKPEDCTAGGSLGGRKSGNRFGKERAGSENRDDFSSGKERAASRKWGSFLDPRQWGDFGEFMEQVSFPLDESRLRMIGEQLFYLPEYFPEGAHLRYLRTGLWLGTVKRGRFEPSQAFAMAMKAEDYARTVRLSHEDPRVIRYLKGETLSWEEEKPGSRNGGDKGWRLVCLEDFPLGWAKEDRGKLKNKYYPGWRYL